MAQADGPVAVQGDLIGADLLSVKIAGNVQRDPDTVPDAAGDKVYGGEIRFAAFDDRVRVISGFDGATAGPAVPDGPGAAVEPWQIDPTAEESAGIEDGASRQRVEVDVLKDGAAHLSAYGRHRSAGQRFRLDKDGLGPDQDSVGYGVVAAFDALSLRYGYDRSETNADGRNGAPVVDDHSDQLKVELSLAALRPPDPLARRLLPASITYGRTDRRSVSVDSGDGSVASRLGELDDNYSLDWRWGPVTTRLGYARAETEDTDGSAGGGRTFTLGEELSRDRWKARFRLGYGSRDAPRAAPAWAADIMGGGLGFTYRSADFPEVSAGIDVAHFAMHLEPAGGGSDWRLTTSLDFSPLMPKAPGKATRLTLSASVGRGDPLAPDPDAGRQLDGTVMLNAGLRF